jgi:membrane-bound inhibitor of C-type lysozyme
MKLTALYGLLILSVFVMATGESHAEDAAPVAFDCEDGTILEAVFDEDKASVTLPDGKTVDLKVQPSGSGFHYGSAKYDMIGKGDEIKWSVGKKTPVTCVARPDIPDLFDEPVDLEEVPLPADPKNPDVERKVICSRYDDFAIKEVDYGEKGAQKLALVAKDAACTEADAKERVIPDIEGYFLGAKGPYLFFTASDLWNGGLPFFVYGKTDLKMLFEDSLEGDSFDSLAVDGDKLTIEFRRAYTAPCSLYLDGGNCAATIKADVKGLGEIAALPECGPAYEAEKKRTPEFAAEIEQIQSVISHSARLVYDGKTKNVEALAGETSCRIAD